MNVKRIHLAVLTGRWARHALIKRKYEVWRRLLFIVNWISTASPAKQAEMDAEAAALELEYNALDKQLGYMRRLRQ